MATVRIFPIISKKYFLLSDDQASGRSLCYGGRIDKGETVLEAMKREFIEETAGFFNQKTNPANKIKASIEKKLETKPRGKTSVKSPSEDEPEKVEHLAFVDFDVDDCDTFVEQLNAAFDQRWKERKDHHYCERSNFQLVKIKTFMADVARFDWKIKYGFEYYARHAEYPELWEHIGKTPTFHKRAPSKFSNRNVRLAYLESIFNHFGTNHGDLLRAKLVNYLHYAPATARLAAEMIHAGIEKKFATRVLTEYVEFHKLKRDKPNYFDNVKKHYTDNKMMFHASIIDQIMKGTIAHEWRGPILVLVSNFIVFKTQEFGNSFALPGIASVLLRE